MLILGAHAHAESLSGRVDCHKKDRYGRIVGTVWVVSPDMPCVDRPDCPNTLDAGLAQLTVGLAWH